MYAMLLLLLSVLLILAPLVLLLRNAKRARLIRLVDKIPGPPSYPFVGSELSLLLAPRNKQWGLLQMRLRKYQPIMRTWVGPIAVVHLTRPEHIEILLSSTRHLEKSFAYKFIEPWLGTGLLTATGGQKWHVHRKMITPTFHFSILDSFVEVFSEKSEILVKKLQKEVGSPGFDMFPYVTHCALDIICETAMGTPVNAQEEAESSTYVRALYDISRLITRRVPRPWLHNDFLYKLTRDGRRHNECLEVLHGFTKKVIQERKKTRLNSSRTISEQQEDEGIGKKKRLAFLDMLLDASEGGTKLTDEEIREEVDTFMFAGHDTTSASICWALLLLGLHPHVQSKVHEELQCIFQGSDRPPTMKDLADMKLLERVIKESLRVYPSAPLFSRLLREDIEIGGYTIPAGSTLRVNVYCLHRNPDQFPNPEKFDPDNFLPERVAKRHPYAYIPFSAGPRNCIGQKFALLEEKTVLSYMLRHYELRSRDSREDMNLLAEIILRPENRVRMSIKARRKEGAEMRSS
ncbi:Cytochrome P450 4C1 [Cryptotermes secundus]|uniref:Cytochrome P450 4C1 n=1 Tax=Cryptotermes secundus TaxID=105785 RepID=A0A2J7R3G9_9NEOP|nr:cytochrome P450 4C1 [Cryptotermes secundus]XP_023705845.1 cytochrome P450 4C1 [Cryptotermes secundus]PNF35384.1 Cytochrome P450 4C1 [Cryptotermes secundus]PNF35385.1 Cytochrome P450 4C1 [Cryptotermes secundus]PNF35386.1 Cytochrome P450 4C1 [Cryptotermes secundus]